MGGFTDMSMQLGQSGSDMMGTAVQMGMDQIVGRSGRPLLFYYLASLTLLP